MLKRLFALLFLVFVALLGVGIVAAQSKRAKQQQGAAAKSGEKGSGLFGALSELLGKAEDLPEDQKQDLQENLAKAEKDFSQVKKEARQAINQANRQLPNSNQPHVVLIVVDDWGFGDVGVYGQQKIKTPHLDRMAAEGARFTRYYSGSSADAASHCSLLTGLHTGHAPLRGQVLPKEPPRLVTAARTLWLASYSTHFVGRWPVGRPGSGTMPNDCGFEQAVASVADEQLESPFPAHVWRNAEKSPLPENADAKRGRYVNELFTDEALKVLDQRSDERPMFFQLSYSYPVSEQPGAYADQPWTAAQRNHAAACTDLDRLIGKVLSHLQLGAKQSRRSTIVYLVSDGGPRREHSEFFRSAGPFQLGDHPLTEGAIRVPAIAWGPGLVQPQTIVDAPWAAWDLLPTLADVAAALRRPKVLDGKSQLNPWSGKDAKPHEPMYWEVHEGGFFSAMRHENRKALGRAAFVEMFDLKSDAREEKNLATTQAAELDKLNALRGKFRSDSPLWPLPK